MSVNIINFTLDELQLLMVRNYAPSLLSEILIGWHLYKSNPARSCTHKQNQTHTWTVINKCVAPACAMCAITALPVKCYCMELISTVDWKALRAYAGNHTLLMSKCSYPSKDKQTHKQ